MAGDLSNTAILITCEGMGSGPADLKTRLLTTFLTLLLENGPLPGALCFYTDGVKLLVDGSPVLDQLHALEQRGVHLIACKTCLDSFGLTDRLQVGVIGGMADIQAAMAVAGKVITL